MNSDHSVSLQPLANAREKLNALSSDLLPVRLFFLVGKPGNLVRIIRPLQDSRNRILVSLSEGELKMVLGKRQVLALRHDFPGAFMMRRRIDDHAVPVENRSPPMR